MVYSNSQAEYEGSIPFARSTSVTLDPSRDHHFCGGRDFCYPRFCLVSFLFSAASGKLPLPSRESHRSGVRDFYFPRFQRDFVFVQSTRQRDAGPKTRTSLCEVRFLFCPRLRLCSN